MEAGAVGAEYTNGTSFYFDRRQRTCKRVAFPVGILAPDWLANATYLGTDTVSTRPCHVWTKADGFIRYWADAASGVPVRWIFFDGAQVGALLHVRRSMHVHAMCALVSAHAFHACPPPCNWVAALPLPCTTSERRRWVPCSTLWTSKTTRHACACTRSRSGCQA